MLKQDLIHSFQLCNLFFNIDKINFLIYHSHHYNFIRYSILRENNKFKRFHLVISWYF
jgi:hypothetical protein